MQLYDSQWYESFYCLLEDVDKRKQWIQNPAKIEVNDHDFKVQRAFYNTLSSRKQVDRSVKNESPCLVDSLKASKAIGNKRIRLRQYPNTSADAVESYSTSFGGTSRRSQRTRLPVPSIAKDPNTTPTNLSKRVLRQRPGCTVANNVAATRSSAKPQGISKRQRTKTIHWKVRKD